MGGSSSLSIQVERPQNGVKSHVLPGSTVAQRVEAKHMPGKSLIRFDRKYHRKLFCYLYENIRSYQCMHF